MFPALCLPTEPLLLLRVASCGLGGLRLAKSGSSPGIFHTVVPEDITLGILSSLPIVSFPRSAGLFPSALTWHN